MESTLEKVELIDSVSFRNDLSQLLNCEVHGIAFKCRYATKFSLYHQMGALENLEAFASLNGAKFYGLHPNATDITIKRESWAVPESYKFGLSEVVPMYAGSMLDWKCHDQKIGLVEPIHEGKSLMQ